jgi:localization factor PodJL
LNYLQAARRAAQFATQNAQRSEIVNAAGDPAGAGGNLAQRLKAIFVGVSVAILVAVAARFVVTYWQSAELTLPAAPAFAERQAPAAAATKETAIAPKQAPPQLTSPEVPAAAPLDLVPPEMPPPPLPRAAPAAGVLGADQPTSSPPAAPLPSVPAARTDVTGSIQPTAPARQAPPLAPSQSVDRLPPAIGGTRLITAAQAGEPAAAYEVATRYAEGRGVPQNLPAAAVWYERAARGGLAPAMFRLGALYEKGNGVAKNLKEARRYYLAAADRGNANAMHNLGVLYAEGIDAKPDFATAAQWFHKSAMFGIADSQYNLAVLYARGIGVERSMTEAFRWFALAARSGDAEAGKKRDEIAPALDQKTLAAVRHMVDTWAADRPAEDAATVAAPPGGWDQAEPGSKQGPDPRARAKTQSAPI